MRLSGFMITGKRKVHCYGSRFKFKNEEMREVYLWLAILLGY